MMRLLVEKLPEKTFKTLEKAITLPDQQKDCLLLIQSLLPRQFTLPELQNWIQTCA
jgi:hypothetical protein